MATTLSLPTPINGIQLYHVGTLIGLERTGNRLGYTSGIGPLHAMQHFAKNL